MRCNLQFDLKVYILFRERIFQKMKFKKLLSTLLILTTILGTISICSKICDSTELDKVQVGEIMVQRRALPKDYKVFTCKSPEKIKCPNFNENSCWMDMAVGFINYLNKVFP